jgi:hypothetical protein
VTGGGKRQGDEDGKQRGSDPRPAGDSHAARVSPCASSAYVGIGILVEILRRLGLAFVEVRKQERAGQDAEREGPAPT